MTMVSKDLLIKDSGTFGQELLELVADWYWETDSDLQFSKIQSIEPTHSGAFLADVFLNKRLWQAELVSANQEGLADIRNRMESREEFRDIIIGLSTADGEQHYLSFSGRPGFEPNKKFAGFWGYCVDISEFRKNFEYLNRFREAMDRSGDAIYLTDAHTMKFVDVNITACQRMGYSRDDMLTMGPADLLAIDPEKIRKEFEEVIRSGAEGIRTESVAVTKEGNKTIAEMHRRPVRLGDNWIVVSIARDITARKRAEQSALRMSRMYAALSATEEAILRAESADQLYQKVCDAAVEGGKFLTTVIFVKKPGDNFLEVVAGGGAGVDTLRSSSIDINDTRENGRGLLGTACRTGKPSISDDYLNDSSTKSWHTFAKEIGLSSAAAVPIFRDKKLVGASLFYSEERGAFDDEVITLLERMMQSLVYALDNFDLEAEKVRSNERIRHMANHDSLTGLPNRIMFNELLRAAIETSNRYDRSFAVMFVDLDRFKHINDSMGHDAGDELLKELASRFKGCLRASDIVARLGGDEFVALVQEVGDLSQLNPVAQKLLEVTSQPMEIMGQSCSVSASIGVAVFPEDGSDEDLLLKNADLAMYQAKEEGANNFQFYSEELNRRSADRLAFETELRKAVDNNELTLHYLPRINTDTHKLTGVEALLRWESPVLGNLSPGRILPVAEETGLILPIGRWVLRTVCEQNMAWRQQGLPPICVAVNLSTRQFFDPRLVEDITDVLASTGLLPHLLELEVTESTLMSDVDKSVELLTELNSIGVRITIQDFGSGYTAISQIRHFPIDMLKVNQSFIRNISIDEEERGTTRAIIMLGQAICPKLVVSGVEEEEQKEFLLESGCNEIQGYLVNKPVAAEQVVELLQKHQLEITEG